jgi:rSAM/selenodomain-associated transferase 2
MQEVSIGIVVPVYNEAAVLAGSLEQLRHVIDREPVVVVDGGSNDDTAEIAARYFPVERASEPNRGAQMNRGAARLKTDVLLFLHADSHLPGGFQDEVRRAVSEGGVAGGCFRLRFDDDHAVLRFYAWFTRLPGRWFHFGDQAFFVRREMFERMGGFRELPFLEDVDFLRRLRRQGRFRIADSAVVTSARRFRQRGVVRQQLRNAALVALFEAGVPAKRLCGFYPHVR